MPREDCQSFLSVLTQISPVFEMFGWKIRVRKYPARREEGGGRRSVRHERDEGRDEGGLAATARHAEGGGAHPLAAPADSRLAARA
jgi:hypothetical protein